jgi:hypothetical protein
MHSLQNLHITIVSMANLLRITALLNVSGYAEMAALP